MHSDLIYYNTAEGREFQRHLTTLHNFTARIIKERKELRKKRKESIIPLEELEIGRTKKRRAFLDLLLEASGDDEDAKLTDVELREEVDTFMFEVKQAIFSPFIFCIYFYFLILITYSC